MLLLLCCVESLAALCFVPHPTFTCPLMAGVRSFNLGARLPEVLPPSLSSDQVFPLRAPCFAPCLWRLASSLGCRSFPSHGKRVVPHVTVLRTKDSQDRCYSNSAYILFHLPNSPSDAATPFLSDRYLHRHHHLPAPPPQPDDRVQPM